MMQRQKLKKASLMMALMMTAGVNCAPIQAHAQENPRADQDDRDVLVVTGRKREERLQDVPVSVAVVRGDDLREGNIKDLEALSAQIPTFQYAESVSGNDQVFVRGVGSGVNFGFENTVGQIFDGFFMGRARFGRASFMDVEQIEILKGPQGAVIGKNTSAGAINTRWAKPTDEFEAYIVPTWEFEGDEGYSIQGAVSGPLSDRMRARAAFRWDDKEGYFENVTINDTVMQVESPSVRATLEYDLSEDLLATVVYQFNKQERIGRAFDTANCPLASQPAYAAFGEDCVLDYVNTGSIVQNGESRPQTTNTTSHFAGLTLDWQTSLGTVSSLTGFTRFETDDFTGGSIGGMEGNVSNFMETYQQVTEELRLVSNDGGKFDYIVGGYFQYVTNHDLDWNLDFNAQGAAPFSFVPPPARLRSNRIAEQESKTFAVFGELTWYLAPTIDATAGIRFTHEEKDLVKQQFQTELFTETPTAPAPFGPPAVVNVHDVTDSLSENQWTPAGSIRWRPSDSAMLYASISTGFKGGGFDFFTADPQATVLQNLQFQDERVTAYEIGGKFQFPDIALQLNVAAFRNKFSDLQVTSLTEDPVTGTFAFETVNAATAVTKGIEADFRWRPIAQFTLNGAIAYLDAEYDEFENGPCYAGQSAADGCVLVPALGTPAQDLSGRSLQYAPDWKASLSGRYAESLSDDLELQLSAGMTYSDDFFLQLDLDPTQTQRDYVKFDASVALESTDGRWRLALIGRNLTDKLTTNFANDSGDAAFFFVEPPRSLALQGTFRFGRN